MEYSSCPRHKMKELDLLLGEQIDYYAARAPEYGEWFFEEDVTT